ncbi:Single-stranded DNA-binding protein [Acropora cervicornis]|uniref:Single-stranded DNA-binding protein n=1 Tax=Acropora cervicornis TaxID=6130 RepID=A0AAD9V7D0_ACRCE|nr:Single-stranded DNA-binding protein [Acropora cervicornis]
MRGLVVDVARETTRRRGYLDFLFASVVACSVDIVFNSSNGSLQGVREMCLEEAENIPAQCYCPVGLNSVQLIGYSGSDPLRGSNDFQPTKFSLATTVYFQTRDAGQSGTAYQFSSLHCKKKTRLFVQGSIQYNNYVDQEGIKRYNTSIVPSMLPLNV